MLDEKDLLAIADLIDSRAKKQKHYCWTKSLRLRTIWKRKWNWYRKILTSFNQYHRISKLENVNATLLLQMIQDLKKEVDELKKKIA